jgi:glutamate N-acetyltransferase/amino-acid N-acetyltransferase
MNVLVQTVNGGVCAPNGFKAGGIRCGIKASSGKRDLALLASGYPCTAAALFTANRVQAASVLVSRRHLEGGRIRAVIANSGNANACTGEAGLGAARRMTELAAGQLALAPEEVAVASTGVIGVPLPLALIEEGMAALGSSLRDDAAGHDAALEAIMTTDTRKKDGALEFEFPGGVRARIGAMVKGSGMIHPSLATMLCFITTDAALSSSMLDRALRRAVNRSFNRLSVDGDTSTNDMVLIMANGRAGNTPITREGPGFEAFAAALEELCTGLARAMARDGEGASRLVTVSVAGAADEESAGILARAVVSSNLVKAACFGADANWGRVLCALGYAGPAFDPCHTDVAFASRAGKVAVCRAGGPLPFSEEEAKRILSEEEIEIRVDLGGGPGKARAWGCDLTYDYVKINGDYRS